MEPNRQNLVNDDSHFANIPLQREKLTIPAWFDPPGGTMNSPHFRVLIGESAGESAIALMAAAMAARDDLGMSEKVKFSVADDQR